MPYIREENKQYFSELLQLLQHHAIANPGELNFLFTEVVKQYMRTHTNNYQMFNDLVGALEGCKLELYRRRIALYEDGKMESNGDVYLDVNID